jgi:hypothetical protein
VSLTDFNREIADPGALLAESATEIGSLEEDQTDTVFDISPELMYTAEHEVSLLRAHVVSDDAAGVASGKAAKMEAESGEDPKAAADESAASDATRAGDRDDSGARRRRGRRGGRRGRGGEQGER